MGEGLRGVGRGGCSSIKNMTIYPIKPCQIIPQVHHLHGSIGHDSGVGLINQRG